MEKKQVLLKNGETYSYFEKGGGSKTLLLIHGNLSSSVYFKPLLERLPNEIKTYAFDLRGYGDSTYVNRLSSLKDLATDVKLFLDALNIKKADVLGWSLGGGVAMEFAAAYPERLGKLILLSATPHRGYPIFKKDATLKPLVGYVYSTPEEMALDPLQVKPVLDAIAAKNAASLAYIYDLTVYSHLKPSPEDSALYISETMKQRNLADADFALASMNMGDASGFYGPGDNAIKSIVAPTLHIWGKLDRTVLEYMVLDNVKAIKNSTYLSFSDCGHSALVDKPDELTKAVLDFIK
ncbi:MAG TPA: alpha/beta hydrolase [Acholeplasmatales bacterium]|nr:alpha/beta hydrolase [Acholeplasmatales bacterium]